MIELLGVGALVLVLLIPLAMITGVLRERLQRRNEAVADITSSWGGEQNVIGPVLGIPYQYKFKAVKEVPAPDGKMERREVEENGTAIAYFLPETLHILGDKPSTSRWFAVRIGALPTRGMVTVSANLSFFVAGEFIHVLAGDKLAALPRGREIVAVQGNLLEGYGAAPVILAQTGGPLTLSTNRCLLASENFQQPVAQARAGAIIASDNYLEGAPRVPTLVLELVPENGPFTALGNISSGDILVNGNPLGGTPWGPLNVMAL
jgi:hypothetical protein